MDKNSAEYKTVMSLFEDGRITAEQRDRLLAALGCDASEQKSGAADHADSGKTTRIVYSVTGMEDPYDASRICSACADVSGVARADADVKSSRVTVVGGDFENADVIAAIRRLGFRAFAVDIDISGADADDEPSEPDEIDEPDEADYFEEADDSAEAEVANEAENSDDGTSAFEKAQSTLNSKLSGLGDKISAFVGKTVKAAEDLEKKISHSMDGVVTTVLNGLDQDGVAVKSVRKKYDVPYDEVVISIKYVSGANVYRFSEKVPDSARISEQCKDVMSAQMYEAVCARLDEQFAGTFKRVCGSEILKMKVCPDDGISD